MGNSHCKDYFNVQDHLQNRAPYLSAFFNAEVLNHSQFLSDKWTASNMDKQKEGQNIFDLSNVQQVAHAEQIEDKVTQTEFKDSILISNIPKKMSPDLLNPSFFDEIQTTYSSTNVGSFRDHQHHKFFVLYQTFYLIQEYRKREGSILNNLRGKLQPLPKAAEIGIRSGVQLIISLLREATTKNEKLKEDTLNFLLDLFTEVKPLSLWGVGQIDIVLDKSLHTVADFLEEVIIDEGTNPASKAKALKVLFSMGMLRGSLPNLLSVVNLVRKLNLTTDLAAEMKLLSEAKAEANFEFTQQFKALTKLFFKSSVAPDAKASDKNIYATLTTDGKYVYVHSEVEGLMRIGTGFQYTMLGKVYKHNPDYRLKERGSLAFVLGRLFFRGQRIAPAPMVEIDPETLLEKPAPVSHDTVNPNSLFAEMTNPEIEFPHDMATKEEDKKEAVNPGQTPQGNPQTKTTGGGKREGPGKKDLRLLRPAQRSPMFTEGRYVYIVSQWTVEARQRSGDSDDEEEGGDAGEIRQARFGIDIYDPLKEFEHVRSIELVDKSRKAGKGEKKIPPPIGVKCLDLACFLTNGTQVAVIIPAGAEDGSSEPKIKFFDLKDGKLAKTTQVKENKNYIYQTYDWKNNVIWGLSENKKTIENIACFSNETIPEKFRFDEEDDEFYQPCDNDKIIDLAREGMNLDGDEGNTTSTRLEKMGEEIQTLMSLGFDVSTSVLASKRAATMTPTAETNADQLSKSMQLFLLANIARLADSFASLQYIKNDFSEKAQNLDSYRKPYCVALLPKVFSYFEEFLDYYSKSFFGMKEAQINDEILLDQHSFLCTLRIMKYNLVAAGLFSDNLGKLGIELPNRKFAEKLHDLIFQILQSQPYETKEYEDVRKALYQEALEIVKYNVGILYSNKYDKIVPLLLESMTKKENPTNRELSLSILSWLSFRNNISNLVKEVLKNDNDGSVLLKQLNEIVRLILEEEGLTVAKHLEGVTDFKNVPTFHISKGNEVGCSFLIELQKEILFNSGMKSQEKSLEISMLHQFLSDFTLAICSAGMKLNGAVGFSFTTMCDGINKAFEAKLNALDEEEKVPVQPPPKPVAGQAPPTLADRKKEAQRERRDNIGKMWDGLSRMLIEKVYLSQLCSMQINTLGLLSSNFLIASKVLDHVCQYLSSLNKLYLARKAVDDNKFEKISVFIHEKAEVFECEHPYQPKSTKKEKVHVPGAKSLRVVFDPKSDLKQNCDYLQFFKDEKLAEQLTERMCKSGDNSTFPKEDLIIEGDTFWYNFYSDSCRNNCWGYKFTVFAAIQDQDDMDWMTNIHRSTCWLVCKCASQLVNGSALQQVLLHDEEQKYNYLLNSKLFSGGMEKCYFTGGKEGVWLHLHDIINKYEAGHLAGHLSSEMTAQEKDEEKLLHDLIDGGETNAEIHELIAFLQKQFAKECLWASLGGELGAKVVRAAFAVVVKHAGLTYDIKLAIAELKLPEVQDGKLTPCLKNLCKKWSAASRMRTWLVEKRKEIDDNAERTKHLSTARKNTKIADAPKKSDKAEKKSKGKKVAVKKKALFEDIPEPELKPSVSQAEDGEGQGVEPMQIKDTEELINKMIETIVKKAGFLVQLIPAKHWSTDQIEKKGGQPQLLFRQSQEVKNENPEDEWKRRLLQWKSVRQSKQVIKSLEEEAHEIHLSLTTSVLVCLQSQVSIRRLKKQVESAYLRAICRTIGFNVLTTVIREVPSSLFRQDVVGWVCSSLRGSENKLYHFSDNLQGCGHYLGSAVNTAFKKLILAVVQSMAPSNEAEEIKSMLEGLKWRYHGDDLNFLAEIDLFKILKGSETQLVLRNAWGKTFDYKTKLKHDVKLVKKLLELFEIIVVLCVGRVHGSGTGEGAGAKKDKLPSLERNVSQIDEGSAEALVGQALAVIFSELDHADKNYTNFGGIDWGAYLRAKRREEKRNEKKKDKPKKKKTAARAERDESEDEEERYSDYGGEEEEEDDGGEERRYRSRRRGRGRRAGAGGDRKEKKDEDEDSEDDEMLEEEAAAIEADKEEEEKKPEMFQEEDEKDDKEKEKEKKDTQADKKKNRKEKLKQIIEREERLLVEMEKSLYSPEFLFRLVALLYRCVQSGSEHVLYHLGCNEDYVSTLLSLIRSAPPKHKAILSKILGFIVPYLPTEAIQRSLERAYVRISKKEGKATAQNVVQYFFDLLCNLRSRWFAENIDYAGDYSFSCELVSLLRALLKSGPYSDTVREIVANCLTNDAIDKNARMQALSIIGGEFSGLFTGGRILITSQNYEDMVETNVLLPMKREAHQEIGTILGFAKDYKEKVGEEEKKKDAPKDGKEKEKYHHDVRLLADPKKEVVNPVVLIHSTINKELASLTSIELLMMPRFNLVPLSNEAHDTTAFKLANYQGPLNKLFDWALDPQNLHLRDSKSLYIKSQSLKVLTTYLDDATNKEVVFSQDPTNLLNKLLDLSCNKVISSDSLLTKELCEEKLFRLLQAACETRTNLDDLDNITCTVKNNELEVLLGKDLFSMKYSILSGFRLKNVSKYYVVHHIENPAELLRQKDWKSQIENKLVLVTEANLNDNQFLELYRACRGVITSGFDLQKFAEEFEIANPQLAAKMKRGGAGKDKSAKKKIEAPKTDSPAPAKIERELKFNKEMFKIGAIINVSDRAFSEIAKETKAQITKEHKDVFEQKRLIDELTECGFPRDLCEKFLEENSQVGMDIIVGELAKLVEARQTGQTGQKKGQKKGGKDVAKAANVQPQKAGGAQAGQAGEGKKKGGKKGKEDDEVEIEKKVKEYQADVKKKEERMMKEDEDSEEEEKGGAKKEKKEKPKKEKEKAVPAQKGELPVDGDDLLKGEAEEEEEDEFDFEVGEEESANMKEDANSCFACKGEKDVMAITEARNKVYDDLLSFDVENRVSTLVTFKQTNYNLSIFYARRCVLDLIEQWPNDRKLDLIESSKPEDRQNLMKYLKLIVSEAIFAYNNFANNILLKRIEQLLKTLFEKSLTIPAYFDLISSMIDDEVFKPLTQLEKRYAVNAQPEGASTIVGQSAPQQKKNKDGDKQAVIRFSGKIANERDLDEPSLEYSLWLAKTIISSCHFPKLTAKLVNIELFYLLCSLITVIRNNKTLVWGSINFTLELLDFYKSNITELLYNMKPRVDVISHPNVAKIYQFLKRTKDLEKKDAYSRRTQMLVELLIGLNRLQKQINRTLESGLGLLQGENIEAEQRKFVRDMTDIIEVMENYAENKVLLAQTWLQINPDLIKNEEKVIDGDHFYHKNLHSYKITLPFASEAIIKFSEESAADLGDSLVFSSDPNGENSLVKVSGQLGKKNMTYPAGAFYLHFPSRGADIYTWGVNDQYQLGSGDASAQGPIVLDDISSTNLVHIDASDTHTSFQLSTGELYSCGTGQQTGISTTSRTPQKVTGLKDKVRTFGCGSNYLIVALENNELYGMGSNAEGRLGLNWQNGNATPQLIDFNKTKVVRQLACGVSHTLIVTSDGSLFGTGTNDHGQLGIVDESNNKVGNVTTFRAITIPNKRKVLAATAGASISMILVKDGSRTEVLVAGDKTHGKLGLGDDSSDAIQFAEIESLKKEQISSIVLKKKHLMAISKNGRVFTWGYGEHGQLGHGNSSNCNIPKVVEFFEREGLKVTAASSGNNHSIFIAKHAEADGSEVSHVFACGDNTSNKLNLKGAKDKILIPTLIEFFEEKNASKVWGAASHSILATSYMNVQKVRDTHQGYTCAATGLSPIRGALYVDIRGDEPVFYSSLYVNDPSNAAKLPKVLLVLTEAITSKKVPWPVKSTAIESLLEEVAQGGQYTAVKLADTGASVTSGILYANAHHEAVEYVSEANVFTIGENNVSPTIYYRLTAPFKEGTVVPVIHRQNFYQQSDNFGYHMTLTPKFNEKGFDYMIKKYEEAFQEYIGDMKSMAPETDEQLVDLMNNMAQKQEKNIMEMTDNLTFPKDELNIRSALEKCTTDFLRKRYFILKNFNRQVKDIIPYVDFSAKKEQNRLRNIYSNSNLYIFWEIKSELFENLLGQGTKGASGLKLKVNRMKASKFIQKGRPDHTGEFTVFGQIFQYFRNVGYSCFKVSKESNPFSVQFVGEASIDAGGPYREAISQICTELQSGALPLFIPSPNQKNDSGQFREKWVLNPSGNSLVHMKMYEFVGVLMGTSIRTRNFMNLDIPAIVWKQLVDVPLTRKDLENIDRYTIQCLDDVINIQKKGVDEINFNDFIQEKFVSYLSDGSEIELIPSGKNQLVTFARRAEYAELVEKVRLEESRKQAEAIRRGLTMVVPEGLLNLVTWRELETLVCGKPILDIELLRQNTVYRFCSESDSVIEYFWRALTEFTPEERSMYLRFVWGRSRLPLTSKDFPMKHQVEIIKKTNIDADLMLPVAHTCFFSIELPKYSAYEILRDKLRYAITHCQAIDTDGRAYDIWDDDE